ncbi:hypothetical protein [Natrinema hispanicum]|uniref:hypothetical protein n=1 Tax=Natrinema hispanicum TaxID=392421 RepID=UPI0013EE9F05|nr:hypothetical protein [Natrinema hispanicum]
MGSQHPAAMRDNDPDDAETNKPGVTDTAGQNGSSSIAPTTLSPTATAIETRSNIH